MNAPLIDDLLDQLRGSPLQQLGQQLDLPPERAYSAAQTALPLLLGGLGRNTRNPDGANALFGALQTDHQGLDPGNVLGTALAGGAGGEGILRHIFGSRAPAAADAVGATADIGSDRAHMLMRTLAPVVLAYLARRVFAARSADGPNSPDASPEGLRQALEEEEAHVRSRDEAGAGLLSMLDRDGDGDFDLADVSAARQPLPTTTAEMRSPRPLL